MAYMPRNVGGPVSLSTTMSIITQAQVPPPMHGFVAVGYGVSAAYVAPHALTASTNTCHRRGYGVEVGATSPATSVTYVQQTATGTGPPTNTGTNVQNYYTFFNYWNWCFFSESNMPLWHISATCPTECCIPGLQAGYSGRTASGQVASNHAHYVALGHKPRKSRAHKKYLPKAWTGRL